MERWQQGPRQREKKLFCGTAPTQPMEEDKRWAQDKAVGHVPTRRRAWPHGVHGEVDAAQHGDDDEDGDDHHRQEGARREANQLGPDGWPVCPVFRSDPSLPPPHGTETACGETQHCPGQPTRKFSANEPLPPPAPAGGRVISGC